MAASGRDNVGAQLSGAESVRHEPIPAGDQDAAGEAGGADPHGLLPVWVLMPARPVPR